MRLDNRDGKQTSVSHKDRGALMLISPFAVVIRFAAIIVRKRTLGDSAMDQRLGHPAKLGLETIPLQVVRRRLRFLSRYVTARAQSKRLARLHTILERSFSHPWVAETELRIRFWPGNETRVGRMWRIYHSRPPQSMHWDAPITISIFRKHKGKKKQALCMSLYLSDNVLHIAQIQGVWRTDVPSELRMWPRIFIDCCRTFAQQERLREVRIPKAATLYSYRSPFLRPDLSAEGRERALERIRRSMMLLYDVNAVDLGFMPRGDWFAWAPAAEANSPIVGPV